MASLAIINIIFICLWGFQQPSQGAPVPPDAEASFRKLPIEAQVDAMVPQTGLIAYDCNSTTPKITDITALDVGPCTPGAANKPKKITRRGQVVQRRFSDHVRVYTCMVLESAFIYLCGDRSHIYGLDAHQILYPYPINAKECRKIIQKQELVFPEGDRVNLPDMNATYAYSRALSGWFGTDGSCQGRTHTFRGYTYDRAVIQTDYKITIRESWAAVDIDSRKINIMGELSCNYREGHCHDDITGTHVWDIIEYGCDTGEYTVLYEGSYDETTLEDKTAVMITQEPFLLYSAKGYGLTICRTGAYALDYPNIYLVPQEDGRYVFPRTTRKPEIQILTYLNAKIVMGYQLNADYIAQVFHDLQLQNCETERMVLRQRLELIRSVGKEVGLQGLGFPGAYAKPAGEVIHIIQCTAVGVILRAAHQCYEGLPVLYRGTAMFMNPGSRVLSTYSPAVPCSPITPAKFLIQGEWIEVTPQYRPAQPPNMLRPRNLTSVPFKTIRTFSSGGIYSIADVHSLQAAMMFPNLRESVMSNVVFGLTSRQGTAVRYDVSAIMNEQAYENIALTNLKRVWGWLGDFGTRVAGLVAIIFLFQFCVGVLQTIVNFQTMRKALGCSAWMICCCFNSCTQLAVQYGRRIPVVVTEQPTALSMSDMDPLFDDPIERASRDVPIDPSGDFTSQFAAYSRRLREYQQELVEHRQRESMPAPSMAERVLRLFRPLPSAPRNFAGDGTATTIV